MAWWIKERRAISFWAIRVLEKDKDIGAAHKLLEAAWQQPESETELQQLRRIAPRLQKRLGRPISAAANPAEAAGLIIDEIAAVENR